MYPYIIGLTGGIASGKSSIIAIFKSLNVETVSADEVYHELIKPENKLWKLLLEKWGEKIIGQDGKIDRKALGKIVFSDEKNLTYLNSITHPEIVSEVKKIFSASSSPFLVFEAPLLIESGYCSLVDEVWIVDIPEKLQIKRLCERNNIDEESAKNMIKSQMQRSERLLYADKIIDNSGCSENTAQQIKELIKELKNETRG